MDPSTPVVGTAEMPLASNRRAGFGFEFDTIKSTAGGGGGVTLPFKISRVNNTDINVIFGTIMDLTPTDVATDITLSNGTNQIYLENTLDADGNVVASAVMTTTSSLPASDADTAILLIGVVVMASSVITTISQSLYFSQGFSCCGRDPADPSTTPGIYEFFVR